MTKNIMEQKTDKTYKRHRNKEGYLTDIKDKKILYHCTLPCTIQIVKLFKNKFINTYTIFNIALDKNYGSLIEYFSLGGNLYTSCPFPDIHIEVGPSLKLITNTEQ